MEFRNKCGIAGSSHDSSFQVLGRLKHGRATLIVTCELALEALNAVTIRLFQIFVLVKSTLPKPETFSWDVGVR